MKNKNILNYFRFYFYYCYYCWCYNRYSFTITNKPNKEINNNNNNNNDDNNNVKHSSDKQIEENKMNKNEKTYKDFFPSSHLI
ncbi:hypothetical protein NW062_01820 [Mycoplasmopsis cynos]|nr:hypothetical protein NW062_01820 [Mycoplasmopsis cynos]